LPLGTARAADIDFRVDATNQAQRLPQLHERIAGSLGPLRQWFARWLLGFHAPCSQAGCSSLHSRACL
jgi:hypothetical protein